MEDKILQVSNLNYKYKNQKVLEDINFQIKEKDYLAILGPNGSGKTTLIKLLLGLLENQTGKISYSNKKNTIGYVPQNIKKADSLFPASVKEVVLTGLLSEKHLLKFYKKSDYKRVDEILKTLNSYELRDKRISELSGGQQQRVLLARAMVKKPDILILDEPTSALDPNMTEEFYKIIKNLNTKGITIILISHDILSVKKYANKIMYLKNEIIFFGDYNEFTKSKEFINNLGFQV